MLMLRNMQDLQEKLSGGQLFARLVLSPGVTWLELQAMCAFDATQECMLNENRRWKKEIWEMLILKRQVYEEKP